MKTVSKTLIAGGMILVCASVEAGGNFIAGKEKSTACQACHGVDGNSTNPQFPRLAGQHADYLVQALQDYKSGARNNPVMTGIAANLSPRDIEDLAAWYTRQLGLFDK